MRSPRKISTVSGYGIGFLLVTIAANASRRNSTNKTLGIQPELPAIPVNPKKAETRATIKNRNPKSTIPTDSDF